MVARADRIKETVPLFRRYREERTRRLVSYVAPFLLGYVVLLLVAIVVGARLAGRIARPVEALAAGARRVATGDLDTRVRAEAPGEVGDLVEEFNGMVAELSTQRAELARLERVAAWRDLARSLAHEIKNPLTPIQLAVQQLADRFPAKREEGRPADDTATAGDAPEGAGPAVGAPAGGRPHDDAALDEYSVLLRECLEIVNEEVESLRRLVREFSEFARLPEPRPRSGDLAPLLRELVRLYGEERVAWDGPAEGVAARFDESELRRALINLVDNGLAACREAGRPERVELGTSIGDGATILTVRDEGCGISRENRERVFEPNFSTKSEGMGLGLAIVEGIVRGHGGTIRVESVPEVGTTFTVRLPDGPPGGPSGDVSAAPPVPGVAEGVEER
jgi:nitrogen fixation/metabolism regulation signal transduction histidine kinase